MLLQIKSSRGLPREQGLTGLTTTNGSTDGQLMVNERSAYCLRKLSRVPSRPSLRSMTFKIINSVSIATELMIMARNSGADFNLSRFIKKLRIYTLHLLTTSQM